MRHGIHLLVLANTLAILVAPLAPRAERDTNDDGPTLSSPFIQQQANVQCLKDDVGQLGGGVL